MPKPGLDSLIETLHELTSEAIIEVQHYVEFLKTRAERSPAVRAGPSVHGLAPDVTDSMAMAIEEGCERVDPAEWKDLPGHERRGGDPSPS